MNTLNCSHNFSLYEKFRSFSIYFDSKKLPWDFVVLGKCQICETDLCRLSPLQLPDCRLKSSIIQCVAVVESTVNMVALCGLRSTVLILCPAFFIAVFSAPLLEK